MSYELDYFPPRGTKYIWLPKALQHLAWTSYPWDHFPAGVMARVDKINRTYHWWVEVRQWNYKRTRVSGTSDDALLACLTAEECCDAERGKLWQPWMVQALEAGWRPHG